MANQSQSVKVLTMRADKINKSISSLSAKAKKSGVAASTSSRARPTFRGSNTATKNKAYCL